MKKRIFVSTLQLQIVEKGEYKIYDEFVTNEDLHIVGKHCSRSVRKLANTGLHVA